MSFCSDRYGAVLAELLAESRVPPLDAGQPNEAVRQKLMSLDLSTAFAPHGVVDLDMARACHAGLWLYHDFLDESHELSQEIGTPTGSYWHALMHRRELDFANSKYWFRRVGNHPVFAPLAREAARFVEQFPCDEAEFLSRGGPWDPFAFVDLCEKALSGRETCEHVCRAIQRCEWELLFDFSYRNAIEMGR
jgi:hypothetical protein